MACAPGMLTVKISATVTAARGEALLRSRCRERFICDTRSNFANSPARARFCTGDLPAHQPPCGG
jgi:hypothetical protein